MGRRQALAGAVALAALAGFPARAGEIVTFDGLYKSFGIRGAEMSDQLVALRGQPVSMTGYMAPPLKPESNFFVLTREPLALCPFCQSDADWPLDIVVVYLKGSAPLVDGGTRITVDGRLDLGSWTDPATGFVSLIRIMDARYHTR